MRLNDNLIDCSELEVFNQESHLLFHARELLPESEVDFRAASRITAVLIQ